MAFQTNTWVNGAWTHQTLDMQDVLDIHRKQDEDQAIMKNGVLQWKQPELGLLTRTVVESPVINWILPCRLRSYDHNDVAFIGDRVLQIRELRPDDHLQDVARKDNFGSKICNARVMDTKIEKRASFGGDHDVDMLDSEEDWPPHCLVLALEDGDLVFIQLHMGESGKPHFRAKGHTLSRSIINSKPGHQLSIDPSSRFLAVAGFQRQVVIAQLSTKEERAHQSSQKKTPRPIKNERYITLEGVIHKMEFLYPSAKDPEHIILLLIVISQGQSRMLIYDWDSSSDLSTIRSSNNKGHLIADVNKLPLLLIPLRSQSAFILVCEEVMSMYKHILEGSPYYEVVDIQSEAPTKLHQGIGNPLWTAWARPERMEDYKKIHDVIYIAREDGIVRFLDVVNAESAVDMNIGDLECNIGTAFACLDQVTKRPGSVGELLVTGGEGCVGGMYEVQPRLSASFIEPIANWSPSLDFALVPGGKSEPRSSTSSNATISPLAADRIFACSGTGRGGSVTELRTGLEARIGLEIELPMPLTGCWALPKPTRACREHLGLDASMLFLANANDASYLFALQGNYDIIEITEDQTWMDLSSQTVAVFSHENRMIHVTETGFSVAWKAPLDVTGSPWKTDFVSNQKIISATVSHGNTLLIGGHTGIQVFEMLERSFTQIGRLSTTAGEITCLSALYLQNEFFAVWGTMSPLNVPQLSFEKINERFGSNYRPECIINLEAPDLSMNGEACDSATAIKNGSRPGELILAGMRNGLMLVLIPTITSGSLKVRQGSRHLFGANSVSLTKASSKMAFARCNTALFTIWTESVDLWTACNLKVARVFLADAAQPFMVQPSDSINAVTRFQDGEIMVATGKQLLLCDVNNRPRTVPRQLILGGTPTRLIYSEYLQVLVIGLVEDGKTTLKFIDADTGEQVSRPVDRNGAEVDYISNLGKRDDRILVLLEWPISKNGKVWCFIIVGTASGRLIIVSTTKSPPGARYKFSYSCRHRLAYAAAVTAAAVSPELGLVFCAGHTLYWQTLDVVNKKFRALAEATLPSPASGITLEGNVLSAVTLKHSIMAFRLTTVNTAAMTGGNRRGGGGGSDTRGSSSSAAASGAARGASAASTAEITPLFTDEIGRLALGQVVLGQNVTLVSDKDGFATGLWTPLADRRNNATTLVTTGVAHTLFEARLSSLLLRFRRGRTMPVWERDLLPRPWHEHQHQHQYQHRHQYQHQHQQHDSDDNSGGDRGGDGDGDGDGGFGAEQPLGLSINGSLTHFTLLSEPVWALLRFVLDLVLRSPRHSPFSHNRAPGGTGDGGGGFGDGGGSFGDSGGGFGGSSLWTATPQPELLPPSRARMHIDGDVLRRVLDERALEALLRMALWDVEGAAGLLVPPPQQTLRRESRHPRAQAPAEHHLAGGGGGGGGGDNDSMRARWEATVLRMTLERLAARVQLPEGCVYEGGHVVGKLYALLDFLFKPAV